MSENEINEVFDIEEEEEIQEEVEQEVVEDIAESGYLTKEQWEASGKDPERYVSEDVYNDRATNKGKFERLKKEVSDVRNEMTTRLEHQRVFLDRQNKQKMDELLSKRDDAVEEADTKEFNKVQDQIDDLNNQILYAPQAPQIPMTEALKQFNEENRWLANPDDKRTAYTFDRWSRYKNMGMGEEDAVTALKADIRREFPSINPRIQGAPKVEGGSKPGKKSTNKVFSIKSVSKEDMKLRDFFSDLSDAEFARTVNDSKGEM